MARKVTPTAVHARFHMKVNVGRAVVHRAAARQIFIPIVEVHPFAIDEQFEFFAGDFSEGAIVVHQPLVDGEDLEHVVAISGEFMLHDQSAARSEWQAFDVIVLRSVRRNAVGSWRASVTSPMAIG